jgi:cysteine desulfurase/selenocysteine lyase
VLIVKRDRAVQVSQSSDGEHGRPAAYSQVMSTALDDQVAEWRADTEGCANVVHFNNAGSSLPPRPVLDAVIDHLRLEARIGGYEAARQAAPLLSDVPTSIAALINADRSEIALVENATRAWDMAFYSIPFAPGDRIITGVAEYASNYLAFLQLHHQRGVEIVVCPDDSTGQIDVEALERLCDRATRLIAITHAPTNGGLVNPAVEIGRIAREKEILFLLDACQSVGQLPIDVEAIGCDFLSATGRKFLRGPRGTGFLYANRTTTAGLHPPFIDLHAATWISRDEYRLAAGATRFENWESYVAGRLGLGVAACYALGIGLDVIEARIAHLSLLLRSELAGVPGITVRDKGARRSGIVTFSHARLEPVAIRDALLLRSINTSVSDRASTRLDFDGRGIQDVVRASVHYFNTDDEIDALIAGIREIVGAP